MLVLVLLRQVKEPVLFVEGNGREVGINGDIMECRHAPLHLQFVDKHLHHCLADVESTEICGHGKTAYLHAGVTAELLVAWETAANLLPAAANHFALAYLVVQQTEVGSNASIVGFEDESIGNAKFLRRLCIVEQELLVEVAVTAIKGGQRIVWSKGNESHRFTNTIQFLLGS